MRNLCKRGEISPQIIEQLYRNKILLRGKNFKCPYCNSKLWYSLSALNDDLRCYCCENSINLPIFSGSGTLGDSFRLNELVSNAVDQGTFPLLLVTNFLFKQRYHGKRFLFNYELYDEKGKGPLAEIDLIFNIGRLIGVAEVKSDRGFEDTDQIDKLLNISEWMDIDLFLFSTLKYKDSDEVSKLVEYLKSKKVNKPIFILTREVLFEKELVNLGELMRDTMSRDLKETNPILIQRR